MKTQEEETEEEKVVEPQTVFHFIQHCRHVFFSFIVLSFARVYICFHCGRSCRNHKPNIIEISQGLML